MDEAQYLSGVRNLRGGKGALYVKAAGNGFSGCGPTSCENANFDPSNTLPYQIVVGAVNADGIKASYSTTGSAIWASAPGGEFGENAAVAPGLPPVAYEPAMVTTDQSGCTNGYSRTAATSSNFNKGTVPGTNTSCNYTNTMNGTSSATPVTVGAIALILEANPALTWRDVKHILASTARQIDATRPAVSFVLGNGLSYIAEPAWTTNFAGFKFHNWYGFGMVNASAAVNMATTYMLGQLGALAAPALRIRPFQEDPDHAAAAVHRNVGGDLVQVGKRQEVVREVRDVVPDVELIRDPGPAAQVLHETRIVWTLLVRVRLAGVDRAEPYPDVGTRARPKRRRFGVPVGQRVDQLVGVFGPDLRRERIDEAQDRTRVRAPLFLLHLPAALALAPPFPVVLRNREERRFRMLAHPATHHLDASAQHVEVG